VLFLHPAFTNGNFYRDVAPAVAAAGYESWVVDLPLLAQPPETVVPADLDVSLPGLAHLAQDFAREIVVSDAAPAPLVVVGCDTAGAITQWWMSEVSRGRRVGASEVTGRRDPTGTAAEAVSPPVPVAGAVLTNCDSHDNFIPQWFQPWFTIIPRIPGSLWALGGLARYQWVRRLPILFGRLTKRDFPAAVVEDYLAALGRDDVRAIGTRTLRGIDTAFTVDAAANLRGFRGPVLLPWATEDTVVFPITYAHRIASDLPFGAAEIVPVADSFSLTPEDNPAALVAAIVPWLQRHFPSATDAAPLPVACAAAAHPEGSEPVGR
jgi:pimeloyl-ACP methyl ester carboxylesterase